MEQCNAYVDHPFGRENEISVMNLFKSFCNHVVIGQWECARACLSELQEQREMIDIDILGLFRQLIRTPSCDKFLVSSEVSSSALFAWLCFQELCTWSQESLPQQRLDLEFRLLLVECYNNGYLQETGVEYMLSLFSSLQDGKCDVELVSSSFETLSSLLKLDSTLGIYVLEMLRGVSGDYLAVVEKHIFSLHLDALTSHLKHDAHSMLYEDFEKWKTNVKSILSHLHLPAVEDEHLLSRCHDIFGSLVSLTHSKGDLITQAELYSCLLSDNEKLLELYMQVELEHQKEKTLQCTEHGHSCSQRECFLLNILTEKDRERLWIKLYTFSIQEQKHFIETLLEASVNMVRDGRLEELASVMNSPELLPLKPLVLLINWEQCPTLEAAVQLAFKWKTTSNKDQTKLHNACLKLEQKGKLQNILCENINNLTAIDEELFRFTIQKKLHMGLKVFSVLKTLKYCTNLSDSDPQQVLNLIAAISEDCKAQNVVHPQEESDNLFLGFHALKTFTDALITSLDMLSWHPLTSFSRSTTSTHGSVTQTTLAEDSVLPTNNNETISQGMYKNMDKPLERPVSHYHEGARIGHSISIAASTSAADIEELQTIYTDQVILLLDKIHENIMKLKNPQFCVEILENLFSLLFLRAEDILDPTYASDSGEEGVDQPVGIFPSENMQGGDTPLCRTPDTPSSQSSLFSPGHFRRRSSLETLVQEKAKVSKNLFGTKPVVSNMTQQICEEASIKQNEAQQKSNERLSSAEAQFSSISQSSASGIKDKHGFLCNEYFMRDGLLLIKKCLDATEAMLTTSRPYTKGFNVKMAPSSFKTQQTLDAGSEASTMKLSIEPGECKKRLVALTQHVSEALWCFQLVSHDCVPFQYGRILNSSKFFDSISSDDEFPELSSEDESDAQSNRRPRKQKSGSDEVQSQTSDSHVTTDDSQRPTVYTRRRRKTHKKRGKREVVKRMLTRNDGIVSRMLADKDTLLFMCLRRGKFAQATQVIKLFSLEDSKQEAEVIFTEQFKAAVTKIKAHDSKVTTKRRESSIYQSPRGLGKGAMSAIAQTAARGLSTVSINSIVDQLLGMSLQPSLMIEMDANPATVETVNFVNSRLVSSMIVLDLACSGSHSCESASNLLDQATKRLPSDLKRSSKPVEGDVSSSVSSHHVIEQGIVNFLQTLSAFVNQLKSICDSQEQSSIAPNLQQESIFLVNGLNRVLTKGVLDINAEALRKMVELNGEFHDILAKARSYIDEREKLDRWCMYGKTSTLAEKQLTLKSVVKPLVTFLEKEENQAGIVQFIQSSNDDSDLAVGYVKVMYEYFKTLSFLNAECQGYSSETASSLDYFDEIIHSATKTIGRLMFEKHKEPKRIEKIIRELGIELQEVILKNCCFSIPCTSSEVLEVRCMDPNGYIVMNDLQIDDFVDNCNASETVLSIFLSYCRALKDFVATRHQSPVVTIGDLATFGSTRECFKILKRTIQLKRETCSLPKTDVEIVCFHLNLTQLMLLHALCYIAMNSCGEAEILQAQNNALDRDLLWQKYCYVVNSLDVISIFDLRRLLLSGQYVIGEHMNETKDPWKAFKLKDLDSLKPTIEWATSQIFQEERFKLSALHPKIIECHLRRGTSSEEWESQEMTMSTNSMVTEIHLRNIPKKRHSFAGMAKHDVATDVTKFTKEQEIATPDYQLTKNAGLFVQEKSEVLGTLARLLTKSSPKQEHQSSSDSSDTELPIPATFTALVTQYKLNVFPTVPDETTSRGNCLHRNVLTLMSPNCNIFQHQIVSLIRDCLENRRLNELSDMLLNVQGIQQCFAPEVVFMKDHAAKQLVEDRVHQIQTCVQSEDALNSENEVQRLLNCVSDSNIKARLVGQCLEIWDIDYCIKFLVDFLQTLPEENVRKPAVVEKLEVMKVYHKICQLADSQLNVGPQIELQSSINPTATYFEDPEDEHGVVESIQVQTMTRLMKMKRWQTLRTLSRTTPDVVLEFLLKVHEFEVSRDWIRIHGLEDFENIVDESHIIYVLEKNPTRNVSEAVQVLCARQLNDEQGCKLLCQTVKCQFRSTANVYLVAQFMLQNLCNVLTEMEHRALLRTCIGCKVLAILPPNVKENYEHLVSEPLLLFEQLLMNMKIDLAIKALHYIKQELGKPTSEPVSPSASEDIIPQTPGSLSTSPMNRPVFSLFRESTPYQRSISTYLSLDIQDFDILLVKYAEKAIEFPVLQTFGSALVLPEMAASSSLGSMASLSTSRLGTSTLSVSVPSPSRLAKSSSLSVFSSSRPPYTPPRQGTRRESSGPSDSPKDAVKFTIGSPESKSQSKSSPLQGSPRMGKDLQKKEVFIMPTEVPFKKDWVPDDEATVCMCCKDERFSMFNRRHHCRRCGRVVCSLCSKKTLVIRSSSTRACDDCFAQSYKPKQSSASQKDRVERMRKTLSGSLSPSVPTEIAGSGLTTSDYQYILDLDQDLNDETREEFYYDHAPSASLCISILNLHSNHGQCGSELLQMTDQISKFLQPVQTRSKNPEVDYGLVISMMKTLLFNAKVRFHKIHDSSGINKCDLYLDRLKIVDLLIANNLPYVPSIQQLTRMDVLRRIRDRLIEDEHWELAKEVSTKCGIDALGVWMAWGKALVKFGDFKAAREKFARCLKPTVEKNQSQTSSKLSLIVEALENYVPTETFLVMQIKSVKDLLAEPTQIRSGEEHLSNEVMQECLFYLNTYGSFGQIIQFYQRHGLYIKALGVIYSEKCSSEIFIENLVMPTIVSGDLHRLQEAMLNMDSSLDRWSGHLNALCMHLNKTRMINLLYNIQVFMKDYVRAAMTCVTYFYQKDAKSYRDLFDRLNYLADARHHLENYLSSRIWTEESSPTTLQRQFSSGSGSERVQRLIMTPRDISKYIHTIELQLEVTKYLNQYLDNLRTVQLQMTTSPSPWSPVSKSTSSVGEQPPTLFGSTRMKADVTCLVILCGNHVNDGFGLAFRIIQDFKLDSGTIYIHVGTTLAKAKRYGFIRQLLNCMKDSGLCTDSSFDEVIIPCVELISQEDSQSKEIEDFIKLMRSDINKINAYMECGKLKSAYMLAVKTQRVEVVRAIAVKAKTLGQTAVKNICDKWLSQRSAQS